MIKSMLISKTLATILRDIRALRLREADHLSRAVENARVVLTSAASAPPEDPFAVFEEWDSEADRRANAGL